MYLRTIMKAHRSFIGEGWITYSMAYRRNTAASKSLDWSQVDFTLYNETFTGRVKSIVRCGYYLSESHLSLKSVLMLLETRQLTRTGLPITIGPQSRSVVTSTPAVEIIAGTGPASLHTSVQNAMHGSHPQSECHQRDLLSLKLSRQSGHQGKSS